MFSRDPTSASVESGVRVSRGALWFGLLGGATAWLAHLITVWLIAEFGCVAALAGSTVAVFLFVASLLCVAVAAWATVVARRSLGRVREDGEMSGNASFMARAGWISSGLFVFIIVVETIPIFYFLDGC